MTRQATLEFDPSSLTGGEPSNLYATREFLELLAECFFPARSCRVEDYIVDGEVFRLLSVDGRPLTTAPWVDMHEPLVGWQQDRSPPQPLRRLPKVSHGIVPIDDFRTDPSWQGWSGGPTVFWRDFPQWSDYLNLLRSRRVLADDQRRRRRLDESLGGLQYTANDVADDVLATCFAWKSARDRELGRNVLFARDENQAFFRALQRRGLMRASTLRGKGQLLAMWLGWVYQGRWSGWVTAYNPDPAFGKYSLGRQIIYPMLEESYRAGHQEFDFSIGMEPYKLFFATHARTIAIRGRPLLKERLRKIARHVRRGLQALSLNPFSEILGG